MANVDILKLKSYVFKGIQCNVITVANRSPPSAISDLHATLYWREAFPIFPSPLLPSPTECHYYVMYFLFA